MNIILIEARVEELLSKDQTGHGFDHTKRVREMAVRFANDSIKNGESVDVEAVEIAALLHDVDDYKLVAKDAAETLENAQRIMVEAGCGKQMRLRVIEIIQNMGYSKALKGIRPLSLEGQIVSDADLCDAIGITGIMRAYQYAIEKAFRKGLNMSIGEEGSMIFDPNVKPNLELTYNEYTDDDSSTDSFINHFFEKLLIVPDFCTTKASRNEVRFRFEAMVNLLYNFFEEDGYSEWVDYLEKYLGL